MSNTIPTDYEYDFGPKNGWIPPSQREEVRWQCGNPKRRKKLVLDFVKAAGAHGIAYMNPKNDVSRCSRITYRILFWVCFVMVIWNSLVLVQDMWSSESSFINTMTKDSTSGQEEDPEYFPGYPRITICRKPFYTTHSDRTEFFQYTAMALGFPFSSLTPEEVSYLTLIHRHSKQPNFTLAYPKVAEFDRRLKHMHKEYLTRKKENHGIDINRALRRSAIKCEEMMKSCVVLIFQVDCCQMFQPVLTSMGLCYTLVSPDYVEQIIRALPLDYTFAIDLVSPTKKDHAVEVGFQIYLTDFKLDTEFDFNQLKGQKLFPGLSTVISAQLLKVDRYALHTDWHGLSQHCPTLPFAKGVDRYSIDTCINFYVSELINSKCQCQPILSSRVLAGVSHCDPHDHYSCITRVYLQSNLTSMKVACQQPCISYSFSSEAKYIALETSNYSRVEIMYDSKMYSLHQHRTTTLSAFMSQIGGVLGLYLGASIITMVEMLSFAVSWGWYKCKPHRTIISG